MRLRSHRDQYIQQCSYEFNYLGDILRIIEESINVACKNIKAKLENEAESFNDDNETILVVEYNSFVYPESAEMVFCRFLYNNYFLSLWATYETGLKEIAMFLSLAKKSKDFGTYANNSSNIVKIFKYFKEIHNIDMLAENPLNELYLVLLYNLRNIIAHSNGRTKYISSKNKQYPAELTESEDGWILLDVKFCRDIYERLSTSFEKMYHLAYEEASNCELPRPPKSSMFHR